MIKWTIGNGERHSHPLKDVRVADFGSGMATALIAKFLAEAGAQVHRLDPSTDDLFDKIYPAHKAWRSCLATKAPYSPALEEELLANADICIIGGERGTSVEVEPDPERWASAHPRLIILDVRASISGTINPAHTADILIQARTGLVHETYPDRPALLGFAAAPISAALSGLAAISAALYQRENDGCGQIIRIGLLESARMWPMAFWGEAERPTQRYALRAPRGARALIFRTLDGAFVQIVLGSQGSKFKLYRALGILDSTIDPMDAGLPNPNDGPDKYFGDVDRLAPLVNQRDSVELLDALKQAGIVCELVARPGENWDDAQIAENRIVNRMADGTRFVGQPVSWSFSTEGEKRHGARPGAPLTGVRVIDFGAFVAGPLVSVGLADLGADVIKIEPPTGDPLRAIYRFYRSVNRGKRSISIEMKDATGRELAHRLVREADIVCSNFRNGVAERLGIDASTLLHAQPDKVIVTNAGYGATGPKAFNPAFDPCIQAACGLEMRAGGVGNPPILNPMMMTDICGGFLGQIGALQAMYRRARDGSGAAVTVPLLNAGLFLLSDIIRTPQGEILGPSALLADQTGYHPAEKLYRTCDGWIAVAARTDSEVTALAHAFTLEEVAGLPRADWNEEQTEAIANAVLCHTSRSALAALASAGVPAEPCIENADAQFFADEHNVTEGLIYETSSAELGRVRGIGRTFSLRGMSDPPNGNVSAKGEDSVAILQEMGLPLERIEDLRARGIIASAGENARQA